jgi:hypothetical protein
MKKIFAVVTVTVFSLASMAQFKAGIKVGGNLSKQRVNVSGNGDLFSNDEARSWHAGLISEVKITENLYLQPQLLYVRKGATLQHAMGAGDTKVRLNYVEVPVNLLYKISLPFGKIFAGGGASFGYAFSGKEEQNGVKRKLYRDIKDWKREELSLNYTVGIEFNNGLFASFNSQKGLTDIYKIDGTSVKNRAMSVSVGCLLDWRKPFRKK